MNWKIPAKTFLLGEYAALSGQSAILLTTQPCFELTLTDQSGLNQIHPDSPAGLWWQQQNLDKGLLWTDPWQGCGGLGASSAQFVACYLAACYLQKKTPDLDSLLQAYYQVSWSGKGIRPSGYDVIAQTRRSCVFINQKKNEVQCYDWPFKDLSFFLIHSGVKLATHHHLQTSTLPQQTDLLSSIADEAHNAFIHAKSEQLIHAINAFHEKLTELNRVAEHSMNLIQELKTHPEVLAIKGCGALGADVILILCAHSDKAALGKTLKAGNWHLLATESDLTSDNKASI